MFQRLIHRPESSNGERTRGKPSTAAAKRTAKPARAAWGSGRSSPLSVRAKLVVGAPSDPVEQEADRAADHVLAMRAPQITSTLPGQRLARQCAACAEEAETKLRPRSESSAPARAGLAAPPAVHEALAGPAQPLDAATRAFFEPRFGRDFSAVRVHTGTTAAQANRSIAARAFAVGNRIAFAEGAYSPTTPQGRRLLAHELAHVVQASGTSHVVRGDFIDDAKKKAEETAEKAATAALGQLSSAALGPPSGFTGDPKCGPSFCQPFTSKAVALANLAWAGPLLLAGIAKKVNSRVVPLWARYLAGGSAPLNLTSTFGADFTASPTTAETTKYLIAELRKDVETNQTALMAGATTRTVDFTPRLGPALAAIDDPAQTVPPQMNFNYPTDIAGNLAGGLGKDETSFPIGAKPSPFNDSRAATVHATLTRQADGSLEVAPAIHFTVKDTIDLCPGDCGTSAEQVATIPLSRFEASGVAGNVPMTIEFAAPAAESAPFTIPAPAPAPAPAGPVAGTVSATQLRIRRAPNTSSAVVGSYSHGRKIIALCQTKGTLVDGVDTWYKTNLGFVSARYVTLSSAASPPAC